MKWIKASDQQPEDWDKVMTRHKDTKYKAYLAYRKRESPIFNTISPRNIVGYFELDAIEWLDESTPDIEQIIIDVFDQVVELCDSYDDGFSFYEARKGLMQDLKEELIEKYCK